MDLTIDVLQLQENTHVLQLLTFIACFLFSVFSQVNSQFCAIVGEDGGKKLPTIQQKTKSYFLASGYNNCYEPIPLNIQFPDISWIWHLHLLLFLPRVIFPHLKCCYTLKIVFNIGTMGVSILSSLFYSVYSVTLSKNMWFDSKKLSLWLLWSLDCGGKGLC